MIINRSQRGVNPYIYFGQALHNFGYLWFSSIELASMHNKLPGFYAYVDKRTGITYFRIQFIAYILFMLNGILKVQNHCHNQSYSDCSLDYGRRRKTF
jgi:hypothetical protein